MADVAFRARFRITKNQNRTNERSPEHNLGVDFTPEQAMAAANWLMTMAEKAEAEGSVIRKYRGASDEYQEVTGFTLWGGLWGNGGSFSPLKPKSDEPTF